MSAVEKVERRVRNLFDLSHVIGVFVMDAAGDTFASLTDPAVPEAGNAARYVLQYYRRHRDTIGGDRLKSHTRGALMIHFIRGREGAVAIAARRKANIAAIRILSAKLAGELTIAVMKALDAVAEPEEAPAKPQSPPPKAKPVDPNKVPDPKTNRHHDPVEATA